MTMSHWSPFLDHKRQFLEWPTDRSDIHVEDVCNALLTELLNSGPTCYKLYSDDEWHCKGKT